VRNPGPGGGLSGWLPFQIRSPRIFQLSPASASPLTGGAAPIVVTIDGAHYLPGIIAFGNGVPLATTYLNPSRIEAVLTAAVPGAGIPGDIAITLRNPAPATSNTVAFRLATANNAGTVILAPLDSPPGSTVSLQLESGAPGSALAIAAVVGPASPLVAWPTPAANMVNTAFLYGATVLVDGIGIWGPAQPGAAHSSLGVFVIPGVTLPSPPLSVMVEIQALYLDGTSPVGWRLGWASPFGF
jgi:hypothetical protein